MTRKELQELLNQYPEDMKVKATLYGQEDIHELCEDNIQITSDTAWINDEAPEDEWNNENGKVELGDGEQYIMLNCLVL